MWCRDVHIPFFKGLIRMSQCLVALCENIGNNESGQSEKMLLTLTRNRSTSRSRSNNVTYCRNKEFAIDSTECSLHMFTLDYSESYHAQFKSGCCNALRLVGSERETHTHFSIFLQNALNRRRCNQIITQSK